MSWTPEKDAQVVDLLKQRALLDKTSEQSLELRNQAANILVTSLQSEFKSCVRMWKYKFNIDESEGESLIYENLLAALDFFDSTKTTGKFTSFFWHVNSCFFKNRLTHMYAQKRTPQIEEVNDEGATKKVFLAVHSLSSPAPFSEDEGYMETLENIIPDATRFEDRLHKRYLLKELGHHLTKPQRLILKRMALGYNFTEVSKRLNMSLASVCNEVKKIKESARRFEADL